MKFKILMGVPEMSAYWDNLCDRAEKNKLGNELSLFKKLVKTLAFLSDNPNHNGLLSAAF